MLYYIPSPAYSVLRVKNNYEFISTVITKPYFIIKGFNKILGNFRSLCSKFPTDVFEIFERKASYCFVNKRRPQEIFNIVDSQNMAVKRNVAILSRDKIIMEPIKM